MTLKEVMDLLQNFVENLEKVTDYARYDEGTLFFNLGEDSYELKLEEI